MNFSEYLESAVFPLYEKEGDPKKGCPPGYKYDKELAMCVPKSEKDAVGNQKYGDKDMKPGQSSAGYNVFGNTGYDGSGYAFTEKPTTNDLSTRS